MTTAIADILSARPDQLLGQDFELLEIAEPNLRITIYEPPRSDAEYVIGADFAYGLAGRDYDTACVLCKDTNPVRQVAEVQGHVGERFDRVLYALHTFYNDAFIVGERQVGLPTLRRLFDEYGVRWLYFDRDEGVRQRKIGDKLGHHRTADDITLRNLRLALVQKQLILRSPALVEQMSRVEFYERTTIDGDRREDEKLKIKLAGGGSPDLCMALCYSWHGIREVPHFQKPAKAKYAADTYGAIFGHEEIEPETRQGTARRLW